jgi:phosphatidylethanolamine-binding protein (PEBP) family uncharacterized protein
LNKKKKNEIQFFKRNRHVAFLHSLIRSLYSLIRSFSCKKKNYVITLNTKEPLIAVMIYDPDAPTPDNPTLSPIVHLLVTNIPKGNAMEGTVILPWTPPAPPKGSPPHRYIVVAYKQRKKIRLSMLRMHADLHVLDGLSIIAQTLFRAYTM